MPWGAHCPVLRSSLSQSGELGRSLSGSGELMVLVWGAHCLSLGSSLSRSGRLSVPVWGAGELGSSLYQSGEHTVPIRGRSPIWNIHPYGTFTHPSWLGIGSKITTGVLRTPSILTGLWLSKGYSAFSLWSF